MKAPYPICLLALVCALAACSSDYISTDKGVVVSIQDPDSPAKLVRVEAVNDGIFHISATAGRRFSRRESLIVTGRTMGGGQVTEQGDSVVVLSTSKIKALVNKRSGQVRFEDLQGNELLSENSRSLEPFTDHQQGTTRQVSKKAWHLRQLWNSPQDEAFYGLGQHQSDEFNYKDRNEYLIQYNTKVTIPFVVSTRHYGILWDNYSLSRWGDARDYAQLGDVFRLYDKQGQEGGLTGTYTHPKAGTLVRTEPLLYLENAQANARLMPDFPLDGAQVLYEGSFVPSESGLFHFMLYYAGYIKVYIDGQETVAERWRTAWNPNTWKFACQLTAGQSYDLRVEWKPDGGVSYCSMRVLSPRPAQEEGSFAFSSEMGDEIDYYFVSGDNADQVIGGYRYLTGKAQIMPKWAMGFWQCREHYHTAAELTGTLAELRRREIPCDVIIQDWNYWPQDSWGSHEFDADRYPDPQAMVDQVHEMGGKVMISVWPKFYVTTEHFKEFDAKGWMYRQAVVDSLRDWIAQGYMGSFYDAYSAGARQLFWQQMDEHLFRYGFDAWWMDASEPNIRDCVEEDYAKALCGPTALGSSTEYLNAYGLMNAQAIYEGQRQADPDRRVFLLTRSGFAGLQRYSTSVWSGDIACRWEDMKAQISAGINFSMAGVPFWSMDIGGFCVEKRYEKAYRAWYAYRDSQPDATLKGFARLHPELMPDLEEWQELQTRWYQFGAFVPLFRQHGQFPYRELWNIAPEDHPAYRSMLAHDRLRYRLLPYLYSLDASVHFDDYTMMRGLAMDFPDDPAVRNIGDQFLLGPALMVCPVYTYQARSRQVYLPRNEGGWYEFFGGRHLDGGQTLQAEAPYDHSPVYVPAGAILLLGEPLQYTGQKPVEKLDVYVFPGQDGEFVYYDDEGTNYNYEKGLFSTIKFSYDDATGTLTVGARQGSFPGMAENLVLNVHWGGPCTGKPAATVTYSGQEITVPLKK